MRTSFAHFLVRYTLSKHFGSNKSAMARYYNRTYDDLYKAFKRIDDGLFSSFLVEVLQSYAMDEFDLAEAKAIYRKWREDEELHAGKCPALKDVHKLRRKLLLSLGEHKGSGFFRKYSQNEYTTEAQCPMLGDGAVCMDYHKWLADQTYDLCVDTCKYACMLLSLIELHRTCIMSDDTNPSLKRFHERGDFVLSQSEQSAAIAALLQDLNAPREGKIRRLMDAF